MSIPYEENDPIVTMSLMVNGKEQTIKAYADTGNSLPLVITKRIADRLGLNEEDVVSEDQEAYLADGSIVLCRFYSLTAKIGTIEKKIIISVIYPDKKLTDEERPQQDSDVPLLGREIMDNFDVLFAGTSSPKKITFTH